MANTTSRSEIAFEEAVWAAVTAQSGAVGPSCREVYRATIQRYRGLGIAVDGVATIVADQLDGTRRRFSAGLAAFNLLVTMVERLGDVVDGRLEPPAIMELMLATKLEMAELYHELAGVAPAADVTGLPSTQQTAEMVAESRAQLEELRAAQPTG